VLILRVDLLRHVRPGRSPPAAPPGGRPVGPYRSRRPRRAAGRRQGHRIPIVHPSRRAAVVPTMI